MGHFPVPAVPRTDTAMRSAPAFKAAQKLRSPGRHARSPGKHLGERGLSTLARRVIGDGGPQVRFGGHAPYHRFTRMLVLASVVVTQQACSSLPPDYVIINRSDAVLAILPGIVVGPCSTGEYSKEELTAAGRFVIEDEFREFDSWAPPGAIEAPGPPGPPIGAPKPTILVISGSEAPQVAFGFIPDAALGPCGGQPRLDAGW
jgi:hypothetical protein